MHFNYAFQSYIRRSTTSCCTSVLISTKFPLLLIPPVRLRVTPVLTSSSTSQDSEIRQRHCLRAQYFNTEATPTRSPSVTSTSARTPYLRPLFPLRTSPEFTNLTVYQNSSLKLWHRELVQVVLYNLQKKKPHRLLRLPTQLPNDGPTLHNRSNLVKLLRRGRPRLHQLRDQLPRHRHLRIAPSSSWKGWPRL